MINKVKRILKKSESDDYPIFIGGEGRSGTTLMRVMLNNHPKIACGPETHFLNDPDFQNLYNQIVAKYSHRIVEYDPSPEHAVSEMYAAMISSFFAKYAQAHSKSRWADKTPHNVKSIDFLLKVFEEKIKFIHMIRDGRDVAASVLTMKWGASTAGEAAKRWKEIIMNTRRHVGEEYYLELKYEDLVADPEQSLRKVCEFIGENYSPKMLEYHKSSDIGGEKESSYSQIRRPIYSESIGRWKKDLTSKQVKEFTKIAGDTLELLGYET